MPQKPVILVTQRNKNYIHNLIIMTIEVTYEDGSYKYEMKKDYIKTE